MENNVSFCEKQRVVLWEITARFLERNGGEWTTRKSGNWKTGKLNCKNTYKTILSRVRARTHHRSFYFFAVTSVTRKLYFTGIQYVADTLRTKVNNEVVRVGLVRCKRYRKSHFTSCVSLNFRLFFVHFFLGVWHLWQQKNNIAVGRRAHVRTRTRRPYTMILQGWPINFYTSTK